MAVFFLDIQTTGPNPEKGHLLEIAWGETAELIQSFVVKVPGEIPLRILSMTGINESELACAVDPAQIAERLRAFVAARPGAICIIHYAKFEKPFLAALLGEIPFEILCTHELAKRVVPQLPSRGLRGLAGFFGYAKGEQKRASAHVEATAAVWKGLGEKIGEATPEAALRWLGESVPKRQGYTYPIERFKRLDLPAKPGIYRFLNKLGAVLYVGKATSLKDRVNSYFRGRKGRDSRKLEMLTQAWDLEVTECPNILEASMLESDLIKELKPPYNLALKSENKNLLFYSRDFQSCGATCNAEHVVGPFPSSSVLERLCLFCRSAKTGEIDPEIFYEPADSEILQRGYRLFLETHSLTENQARGVRTMIAFGMQKLRRIRVDEEIEAEVEGVIENAASETEEIAVWTPEDVAEGIEGLATGAARELLRSRAIRRLVNARIEWKEKRVRGFIELVNGWVVKQGAEPPVWVTSDVKTYDRLSVLATEIAKGRARGVNFLISSRRAGEIET